MPLSDVTVLLPTADRRRALAFYRDGLGLIAFGEPADDGVPEPLQFDLGGGARLVLVPTGGFGWVLGDRPAAAEGHSECVITFRVGTESGVVEAVQRAVGAGAVVVTAPGPQPWGHQGSFTDPDGHLWVVTSLPFPN